MDIIINNILFIFILISALAITVMAQIKLQCVPDMNTDFWGFPVWLTPIIYLLLFMLIRGTDVLNNPLVFITLFLVYIFTGVLIHLYNTNKSKIKWHYPLGYTIVVLIFIA